jgi:hypothetical protein
MVISPDLREWLVPGLAGTVATVDRSGQPQLARVWATRLRDRGEVIEIYVLRSASPSLLDGLVGGGRAALNLIDVGSYRSRTFKGACEVGQLEPDPEFLQTYLNAMDRAFVGVGMPPGAVELMLSHCDEPRSMIALWLAVDSVFDQSPKPGAGVRL